MERPAVKSTIYVQVAFYEQLPEQSENGCFMQLAAWWTQRRGQRGKFAHCEIRFRNDKACSIVQGRTVHYEKRVLSNVAYKFIDVPVTKQQEKIMRRTARDFMEEQIGFNAAGMYINFWVPFEWMQFDRQGRLFFCAELVVTIFQRAGLLKHLKPYSTSPNLLYEQLDNLKQTNPGINMVKVRSKGLRLITPGNQ